MHSSSFSHISSETNVPTAPICDSSWRSVLTTHCHKKDPGFPCFPCIAGDFRETVLILLEVSTSNTTSQICLRQSPNFACKRKVEQTFFRGIAWEAATTQHNRTLWSTGKLSARCSLISAIGCTSSGRPGAVSYCWLLHLLAQLSWTSKWTNCLYRRERRNKNPACPAHVLNTLIPILFAGTTHWQFRCQAAIISTYITFCNVFHFMKWKLS